MEEGGGKAEETNSMYEQNEKIIYFTDFAFMDVSGLQQRFGR